MKAAWYLRSRQILSEMRFWIAITGYDIRDPSRTGKVYLLYLVIFFSLWGFMVLSMFAAGAAYSLQQISPANPSLTASVLFSLLACAWWIWKMLNAARVSPVRFSLEDATLICATPAPRRSVIFSWFVSEWFTSGVLFWAVAVVLGFALMDIATGGASVWKALPLYFVQALRFLLPALFIHCGMLATTWALGCLRLQKDQERRILVLIPLLLAGLLLPGILTANHPLPVFGWLSALILQPLFSASGLAGLFPGFALAPLWTVAGFAALYLTSPAVNLSRAAQETGTTARMSAAAVSGDAQSADSTRVSERLRSGKPPKPLPNLPSEWAVVWSQSLRVPRSFNLGKLWNVLMIFGLPLTLLLLPDWASRSLLILFWLLRVQDWTSQPLRADLRNWYIFQSLPFKFSRRMAAETLPTALVATGLVWAALLISHLTGLSAIPWSIYPVIPFLVANVAYAGNFDVLRQWKSENALSGVTPSSGVVALLLGAGIVLSNGFLWLLAGNNILGVLAPAGLDYLIWRGLTALGQSKLSQGERQDT